jgi:ATP-dependent Zn protease
MSGIVSTAYHESGHALLAVLVGWRLDSVTIERNGNSLGHITASSPDIERLAAFPDLLRFAVTAAIAVKLAGPLAEAKHLHWLLRAAEDWPAGAWRKPIRSLSGFTHGRHPRNNNDYDEAHALAALTSDGEDLIARCEHAARAQLDRDWHRVEALSDVLLKQHTVAGEQARMILLPKRPAPRQLSLPFPEAAP